MATPMVAATAALMLQREPGLTPAMIKARLMQSARKVDWDPTTAGAGVLDIDAALNASGIVAGEALSPLIVRDEATNGFLVEDTAAL